MNDRIMQLSRAFLYPEGVPGNPRQRYYDVNYRGNSYLILFKLVGFSVYNIYSYQNFRNILYAEAATGKSQVFGAIHAVGKLEESNPSNVDWPLLQKQISIATLTVQSAVRILSDVGEDVRW